MQKLFFGTFAIYKHCLIGLLGFSLVEASARSIQLGAFGAPHSIVYGVLEVLVWAARLGIVLVILGDGDPRKWSDGAREFSNYTKKPFALAKKWKPVLLQVVLFGVMIFALNIVGDLAAQWLVDQRLAGFLSQREPIIFFIKNMTVIPLTLVFAYQTFIFIQRTDKRLRSER